jgi:fucose 4-O-acetylase-like acetyltransferase
MSNQPVNVPKRQLWFDAARGIAICFIVFHHGISSVITNYDFSNLFIEIIVALRF